MLKKTSASALKIKETLQREELQGNRTKKETALLKVLTNWHNNSNRRNFFIGKSKVTA